MAEGGRSMRRIGTIKLNKQQRIAGARGLERKMRHELDFILRETTDPETRELTLDAVSRHFKHVPEGETPPVYWPVLDIVKGTLTFMHEDEVLGSAEERRAFADDMRRRLGIGEEPPQTRELASALRDGLRNSDDRRVGCLRIPMDLDPDGLETAKKNMWVLGIIANTKQGSYDVYGTNAAFREVPKGEEPPVYHAAWTPQQGLTFSEAKLELYHWPTPPRPVGGTVQELAEGMARAGKALASALEPGHRAQEGDKELDQPEPQDYDGALHEMEMRTISELRQEIEEGDYWRKRLENFIANGGCPYCLGDDEGGHKDGCEMGDLEQRLSAAEVDLKDAGAWNKEPRPLTIHVLIDSDMPLDQIKLIGHQGSRVLINNINTGE